MPLPDDVTVVIPAKNEEQTVAEVVTRTRRHVRHVIVVDGRSVDATATEARAAGAIVISDHGRGKGEAIRCAIPCVSTPVVVFLDADGSHDPDDIPPLVAPILAGVADHVTGSRLIGGSSELHGGFDEFLRLAGSSFITACINWRFNARLSDSQNGFRAIRTSVVRQLGLRQNSTTVEQEMIVRTLAQGFRMAEVPCHEFKRAFGQSHIRLWRAAPVYAWSLLQLLACRRQAPAGDASPFLEGGRRLIQAVERKQS